ncbi:mitochondrial ribosomal subunit protein-domain-containing protein, partial [Phaeosphaeriaceae sp. PMI808]
MATLPRRLLLQSRQCPSRITCRASPKHAAQWQRAISTTRPRCADADSKGNTPPKLTADEEATAAQLARIVADLKALDPDAIADAVRKGQRGIPIAKDFDLDKDEDFEFEEFDKRKIASGFWAEGEESMGPDEDYFGDDLTSLGHANLNEHRQLREYNRLVTWELPLLHQLAKPFTPPTTALPFRFRYTSYLGDPHPAANKVVVQFNPTDLSLAPAAREKLIKLAGPRYNPSTSIIKLSCEKFDTQPQNKRFLGETIAALVKEASEGKDAFEDVPFDFRHCVPRKRWEFPREWVMTGERRRYLDGVRAERARGEDQRVHNGEVVDGRVVVQTSLPFV